MKINKLVLCILILLIAFPLLGAKAKNPTLFKMLIRLNKSHMTSLQAMEVAEGYKGKTLTGNGKVKDILRSFASEDEAMVYLTRRYGSKKYELIVAVSKESVQKLKKGKRVKFEGKFAGMSYDTLRFEEGKILSVSFWPF